MRRRLLLIIAILLLIVAGLVFVWTRLGGGGGRQASVPTPAPVSVFQVVFASQDIPAGAFIAQDNVTMGPWPTLYRLDGLITDSTSIIGMRARVDLKRGEPIFMSQIAQTMAGVALAGSDIALDIAPGDLAIAIPMTRLSGVAFAPQRGDHVALLATLFFVDLDPDFQTLLPNKLQIFNVDQSGALKATEADSGRPVTEAGLTGVVGTFALPSETQRARPVSAILVPTARVLHVGNVPTGGSTAAQTTAQGVGAPAAQATPSAAQTPDIIILEVSPQDALAVNLVMKTGGDLSMALRSTGDTTALDLPSWDLQRLISARNITLPPKLPYGQAKAADQAFIPVLTNDQVPTK
ncbi:MAG: SAF domain-containing protein [Anaerolineales bacterium]|jgi:Flp pilus assembly protein CpaB